MSIEFIESEQIQLPRKKEKALKTPKIGGIKPRKLLSVIITSLLVLYLILLAIPKPASFYERLGGVIPFRIESKDLSSSNYHPYVEPVIDEDGDYTVELDPAIVLESVNYAQNLQYQSYFNLANIQYAYEEYQERLGVELIDGVKINVRNEKRALGGGYATDEFFVVRLDGQHPENFDKSYTASLIAHEFFHVIHIQHAKELGMLHTTPQWMIEGTAVYFAEPSDLYLDGGGFNLRFFIPAVLDYDHTNVHSFEAYRASGEFINYIADKYGEDKLIELLFHPQFVDFGDEFKRIYGKSLNTMYLQWYLWGAHTGL